MVALNNSVYKPLISIIVNCFNGEKYLKESLLSILKQTYSNWEVIFWDNQSSDNSKKITNVADPTANNDVANKAYVDSVASGLDVKEQNAIDFLDTLEAESIGAITGFHIVEHLQFPVLIHLIQSVTPQNRALVARQQNKFKM